MTTTETKADTMDKTMAEIEQHLYPDRRHMVVAKQVTIDNL